MQNSDVAEMFNKVANPLETEDESRIKIEAYPDAAHHGRTLAHGDFGARLT